jgi:hypothetical protein
VDLLPMGGAYNRRRPDATGFAHRATASWSRYEAAVSMTADDRARRAARDRLDRLVAGLRPVGHRPRLPQLPRRPRRDGPRRVNRARLTAVRTRYDPAGVFAR